jgi:hypothetical protein
MLSLPQTFETRRDLREAISDYLIERIEEPWMHDLMVLCEELDADDVTLHRSSGSITTIVLDPPPAVAAAVLVEPATVDGATILVEPATADAAGMLAEAAAALMQTSKPANQSAAAAIPSKA